MKLRQKPDDFIVEEIPSNEWKPSGKYAIYKVSKVGMTTFAAEKVLSTHCDVPFKRIGFAGLKDTHARTTQYFSVETSNPQSGVFKEQNVSSELVGFLDEPLKTGDLKANKFVITVRDVRETATPDLNKAQVAIGVPNYFDSQRFGSLKGVKGFIAKDILKGDYESAVKKVITATTRHQKAKIRGVRKFIKSNWGDWPSCLEQVNAAQLERTVEGTVIRHLSEFPQDFKGAFQRTFKGIREIFFSAYQSFIWNECVKRVVRQNSKEVFSVDYEAGKLVFPRKWNPGADLKTFPLVAYEMSAPEWQMKIINEVLKQENITLKEFKTEEHIYIAREREVILKPEALAIFPTEDDDLNEHKKKVVISFTLPKGSYATIVLKALFES
jgi:tRNA pseudouridine13 synthase